MREVEFFHTPSSGWVFRRAYYSYIGAYIGEDGWVFTISRHGNRLLIKNGAGGLTYELFQIARNEFTAKEIPEVISSVKNERGEVTHLLFNVDDISRRLSSPAK